MLHADRRQARSEAAEEATGGLQAGGRLSPVQLRGAFVWEHPVLGRQPLDIEPQQPQRQRHHLPPLNLGTLRDLLRAAAVGGAEHSHQSPDASRGGVEADRRAAEAVVELLITERARRDVRDRQRKGARGDGSVT